MGYPFNFAGKLADNQIREKFYPNSALMARLCAMDGFGEKIAFLLAVRQKI